MDAPIWISFLAQAFKGLGIIIISLKGIYLAWLCAEFRNNDIVAIVTLMHFKFRWHRNILARGTFLQLFVWHFTSGYIYLGQPYSFFIFYKRVRIFALPPQLIVAAIFLVLLRELQIRLHWADIRHIIGSFSQDRTVLSWAENPNQRPTMQIWVSPFNYSVVHLTPKYIGCSDNFGK